MSVDPVAQAETALAVFRDLVKAHLRAPSEETASALREALDQTYTCGHCGTDCLGFDPSTPLISVSRPETEWEWGVEYDISADESTFDAASSREEAQEWVAFSPTDTGLRRRRKAGPWMPYESEQS